MSSLASLVEPAPAFYLVIHGMTDPNFVPLGSNAFQFDGSANWRLELPSTILTTATSNKENSLKICVYLTQSGITSLTNSFRMDIRACLLPTPPPTPDTITDATHANYGWKTVAQLHPTMGIAAIGIIDWNGSVGAIPHSVVLMVAVVAGDSAPAFPIQEMLEDNAVGPAPAQGKGGGGGGGGGGSIAPDATHVATLPTELIGLFIGTKGSTIKNLKQKHGHCQINVGANDGKVMVSGCNDLNSLYNEIQTFISTGGGKSGGLGGGGGGFMSDNTGGGGGFNGGGFGGGGGGGSGRRRNNNRRH